MSKHRVLFAVLLSSAAATALAQEAALATDSAAALGAESLFAAPAPSNDRLVAIKGVVSGSPESVSFTGNAKVSSRYAADPDFNRPRLVLTIDLTSLSAVGSTTGAKYVVYGPELVQRPVAASHSVEITFPFKSSKSATAVTARTGVASFVLDFDVNTGAVTSASGNVSSPNFPR
jgi:hypothetical protein